MGAIIELFIDAPRREAITNAEILAQDIGTPAR